ncbi:F-box associated ubiquitination effector family protein [Raphanus sativus]|uniref:F-box protein At1g53360 n=1 Tax=Raphanus sativus TaxID=3726 RepID=A0A6J0JI78_RAPSA|nr:putative F-box protein At1g53360 [Raphanus sativus]XP_056854296.1 putative F-box protein At1g53360 [Raphanus sativus]KAJ4870267.1 F-box associated ubiquitination effector family protein [Raphanus sativus]KAJ4885921.1 F-box associated ubiquitination effector family protein [Raphanus sativus]
MKNVEEQFSKDLLIKKPSNSVRAYSDPIPADLLIDIFSRVPAESIARFRCVSKFWGSILCRHDFTELFLTRSLTRPRLLFTFNVEDKLFIYSSPQPQNLELDHGDNYSLVATRYKDFPKHFTTKTRDDLSSGLVCLHGPGIERRRFACNPVTGEFTDLAKVKATHTRKTYVGYDPINKQFKVLFLAINGRHNHVVTFGNRKRRSTIECKRGHAGQYGQVCINGVLYYGAYFKESKSRVIVCFDFRFEKFSFIELDRDMHNVSLFNYKGKLGAYKFSNSYGQKLVLWVLEDAEKHKWSGSMCVLSHLYNEKIGDNYYIVGITSAGDIVFMPFGQLIPNFHLFFYNMERETCTRLDIEGFGEFGHHNFQVTTYLNFVENVTPL